MYALLKLIHILCAVAAFGSTLTYGFWALLGAREPEHEGFALRGVQFVDNWLANPAFAGAFVSGWSLVRLGGWTFTLAWVWGSLALMAFTTVLAFTQYQPLLRRQIEALETGGPADPLYQRLTREGMRLGWIFTAANLAIFALMTFKPV